MLIRTISGAIYIAIITVFFFLRQCVDFRLFAILIWIFCSVGTFEVARANKNKIDKIEYFMSIILGGIIIPIFCLIEYLLLPKFGVSFSIALILLFLITCIIVVSIKNKKVSTEENKEINLLSFFYPSLPLIYILNTNSLPSDKAFIALLLIFIISPLTDTMAYLVGMAYNKIKKGNAKKLCPKLSPKKTIAGAIGGLFGGVAGGIIVYFACFNKIKQLNIFSPLFVLILIGMVSSLLTQIGDLFESYIKRKAEIKDMGKIMPGHGGIMDRIDGMLFAGILINQVFTFI